MTASAVLAIDLGAESGRGVLVVFADRGGDLALHPHEVHRFQTRSLPLPGGQHWDLPALFGDLVRCIAQGVARARELGAELRAVGVDAWGVDFGLLGPSDELLGLPRCYRDPRSQEAFATVLEQVGRERLYERTGIQFLPFNTIYQLAGLRRREPRLLDAAQRLLFVPDLLHWFLTGERAVEATIASTSQLLDPRSGDWDLELCRELDLPAELFGPLAAPGTVLGPLRAGLREATGASADLQVILPASHDTASAVVGVPAAAGSDWAYLSSGTWSLLGLEVEQPILTGESCAASFTNEWGVDGTFRFLKNIAGLFLVQECRRAWTAAGVEVGDYAAMTELARQAGPVATRLDLTDPRFVAPGDMPAKVQAFARETGQPVPVDPGSVIRCCLESLAEAYAATFARALELSGRSVDVLHLVGGGAQNDLLTELTATAIGRPVLAGPAEATALGNALWQARGLGLVGSLAEARDCLARSVTTRRFGR